MNENANPRGWGYPVGAPQQLKNGLEAQGTEVGLMEGKVSGSERTIGVDVGDHRSQVCMLDGEGAVIEEGQLRTAAPAPL